MERPGQRRARHPPKEENVHGRYTFRDEILRLKAAYDPLDILNRGKLCYDLSANPPCIECGLCRETCPVFTILRQDQISPRGLAILADRGIASAVFYQCTLCRTCRVVCPVGHDTDGENVRAGVAAQGVETEVNRTMIVNIREYGNSSGSHLHFELHSEIYGKANPWNFIVP